MKIKNILRDVLGVIFIMAGIVQMFDSNVLSGFVILLLGISLLPIFYEKTKLIKYKHIQIILPIILLTISVAVTPTDTTQNTDASNETVSNTQNKNL